MRAALGALAAHPARLVALVIGGAVLGIVAWVLGLDAAHAVAGGFAVVAVGVALTVVPEHPAEPWERDDDERPSGTRNDVRALSWALRPHRGRVRSDAVRRLRRLTAARLAGLGVVLDDPAARTEVDRVLGPAVARTVLDDADRLPTQAAVRRLLDALDTLDTRHAPDTRGALDTLGARPEERNG